MLRPTLKELVTEGLCSIPAFDFGYGADNYRGLGYSVAGGGTIDIAARRVGLVGNVGVGLGAGITRGPQSKIGPMWSVGPNNANTGGRYVSANVGVSGTAVVIGGITGNYNFLGTDKGFSGGAITRAGGVVNVNLNANVALRTPQLYNLNCGA